ncbi:Na+/H+ antiporter NhaC family protein [Leucobacter salsicius]|uniref:Na+/H+ antiporter NhaC family protein n=1 Tax=Leucobacter salsicius TaxID=664638 RepID=UPI00034D4C8A|nr:Na+/H+ antiporter NhaC family protein [Leucobacter salsicius]
MSTTTAAHATTEQENEVRFRIGLLGAFIPPIALVIGSIYFFVGEQVFDLTALAVAGFIGIFISSWLARSQSNFWNAAIAGVSTKTAATLFVLMLMVGLLSEMLKTTGVSSGFIWLAQTLNISSAPFARLTFLVTGAIALATGSSIGTMFTMFPIMYSAGVAIGAEPVLLAGAILSGAIFGDNLAPISDTTVISATTQRYRRREGLADVGGVVRARTRYALPAAGITAIGFLIAGFVMADDSAHAVIEADADPTGLWMLLAVAALLIVAFTKRDIYLAVGVGLVVGTITALVTGLTDLPGIVGASEGAPTGYLITGFAGMLPLIGLLVAIFSMIGIIEASGIFDRVVASLLSRPKMQSVRGAEITMGISGLLCTVVLAGLNGPGIAFAGPLTDKIGGAAGLHPYRRSNVMDCFAMVGTVVPIVSSFLLIASVGTQGYEGVPALSIFAIVTAAFYPFALALVLIFAIATGWGRTYEGQGGVEQADPDLEYQAELTGTVPVMHLK